MQTGTVKFFNTTRGFGFISPDDGSKDVFVHVSAVERSGLGYLSEGQRVRFEVQRDPRGPKAVNLRRLSFLSPARPPFGAAFLFMLSRRVSASPRGCCPDREMGSSAHSFRSRPCRRT